MTHTLHFKVHEVTDYINWLYFFHAWGFPSRYSSIASVHGCVACRQNWLTTFPSDERERAAEAIRLFDDAQHQLRLWDTDDLCVHFRVSLYDAFGDGEDILLPELSKRIPLLRQQSSSQGQSNLCLSDFVRPLSLHIPDRIGLFASTVDSKMEQTDSSDDYHKLLSQTLADRLAEAAAEKGHLLTRKDLWGYAPNEHLTIEELFQERYQGKRPAVGYPSLPDQSLNFLIGSILDFHSLGIELTENGAMMPHASTCGLMLSHPATCHFSIGVVGEDQLHDYAKRRGISPQELSRFLVRT